MEKYNKKLILPDGTIYYGYAFGGGGECVGELIVNSSISGYQKTLTHIDYQDKIVLFTYPLIGNTGASREDDKGGKTLSGMIVKEVCHTPSHFTGEETLDSVMKRLGIVGIYGIDTRGLMRKIRNTNQIKVYIADVDTNVEEVITKINI